MAIKINFDTANNPELPTLILATRDGSKLGLLEAKQIELSEKLNGASEITFIVNKYVDGRLTNLWDKIVDFKLVYCQEWDVWFEIRVEIDEDTKTVKTVFGTQLAQAELSQLMLYNIEINTEADISRDDYKISVLYDPDNPDGSILHRLFEKAPHYSFGHVDGTLYHIQRSFSFDETSIYDALQEIAEEIGCLFIFHSGTDDNGNIERFVSVHDLEQYCRDCGYRGEFTEKCPKCNSGNIQYGYGEDTTIFVTADELASNNIQFTTDTDSVKNCFKLEAGDDLMTATIRNCNPNGTDYIWYFSDSIKEDMSQDLKDKLTSYDALYLDYQKNRSFNLDESLWSKYNAIVDKYKDINKDLKNIEPSITGYSQLMNAYYNVVDLSLYLESSMMPTVETSGTTAAQEAAKLTPANLSTLAVTNLKYATRETVNSIAVGMAKVFVKPTYKVEINGTSTLSPFVEGATQLTWEGRFTITNYSDEEDTFTTNSVSLKVDDDAESFTKQKLEKALNNADTEDYSAVGLFKKSVHSSDVVADNCGCDFCKELRKYALKPLSSFRDTCQACIDILVEQGYTDASLYDSLYLPYWRKLKAIEKEMKVREEQIAAVDGVYDTDGNLLEEGLASKIEEIKESVQDALDFESYLGDDLLIEFSSYRREDKYKNENYISDGLNNAELFERALEFIETAENEIFKSAELQHSISSSLKNLMAIEKFKPLADCFEVGNWMRTQIDDAVYKLRLLEYNIDFDSFEDIPVVFSDVSKVRNGITDLEDIFSQASSMTTHYDAVKKQASKGQAAQGTIEQWLNKGLNSALVRINSNNSEEVSMTQSGILCRSYDASTDSYSNEQLKLTHNIMAYTNDDWRTVKQAIGKHEYVVYDEKTDTWMPKTGYGMSAEFVTSGYLIGSTIVGGEIYSSNYKKANGLGDSQGTYINLTSGAFNFGGKKLVYDADKDTLTLSGVTIQWDDTNKPDVEVTEISGFEDYIKKLDTIEDQVDGKAETWYQSTDPSTNWTTVDSKKEHIGDLWYYTGETVTVDSVERRKGSEWIWQNVGGVYKWCEMDVPDEVYDSIDGKSTVYVELPSNPEVGDLLIPTSNIGTTYLAGKVYKYNGSSWVEINYTDDTKADSALGVASAAKELGEKLSTNLGIDFNTQINDKYIISPSIGGGYLCIGDKSGVHAEITTDGKLIAQNAEIHGAITATSLTLEGDIDLSDYVDIDFTSYAKTEDLDKINKAVEEANKNASSASGTASNAIAKVGIIGDNAIFKNTSIGSNGNTTSTYFCVSSAGLLEAQNAVIRGKIYASEGEFFGDVTANNLNVYDDIYMKITGDSSDFHKVMGLRDNEYGIKCLDIGSDCRYIYFENSDNITLANIYGGDSQGSAQFNVFGSAFVQSDLTVDNALTVNKLLTAENNVKVKGNLVVDGSFSGSHTHTFNDISDLHIQCGQSTTGNASAGSNGTKTIKFGQKFSNVLSVVVTPILAATNSSGQQMNLEKHHLSVYNVNTDGFDVIYSRDHTTPATLNFYWIAIGTPVSSGSSDSSEVCQHYSTVIRYNPITAATCTTTGSREKIIYCDDCETDISTELETIPAMGHIDSDGDGYCDDCGATVGEFSELIITEGVETSVNIATQQENVYLKFIPQYSGSYTFESLNLENLDPDGYIYDESKSTLLKGSEENGAFSATYDSFVAGTIYYLGVGLYSGTGTVTVKVSYNDASSGDIEETETIEMQIDENISEWGSVTVKQKGVDVTSSTKTYTFNVGDTITIEAIPNNGYHFSRWFDNVTVADISTDNPYTFDVDSSTPQKIRASFGAA